MPNIKLNYYCSKKDNNISEDYLNNKNKIIEELVRRKAEVIERVMSGVRMARNFVIKDNIKLKDIRLYNNGMTFDLITITKDPIYKEELYSRIYIFKNEVNYVVDNDKLMDYENNLDEQFDFSILQYEEESFFKKIFNKGYLKIKEEQRRVILMLLKKYYDVFLTAVKNSATDTLSKPTIKISVENSVEDNKNINVKQKEKTNTKKVVRDNVNKSSKKNVKNNKRNSNVSTNKNKKTNTRNANKRNVKTNIKQSGNKKGKK